MEFVERCEIVRFATADGTLLHGLLFRPKRRTRNVIIHLHGIYGTFYRGAVELGQEYARLGYNFMSIEQHGSYSLFGLRKKNGGRVMAGAAIERFEDSPRDVAGAITAARSIGMDRIYLEGTSSGAQKAAYYQYRTGDRRVRALILVSPMDDYNSWKHELGRSFRDTVRKARRLAASDKLALMEHKYGYIGADRFLSVLDPERIEARLFNYERERLSELRRIRVPVFTAFGSMEHHNLMPVREYARIISENCSNPRSSQAIIAGANHYYSDRERQLAEAVTGWLARFR
ncbi:MAG: hypothetical protein KGH98_04795 [Candidatus Micrarchaeota archaeon]|nr:hypothetical protein [Candidatus Micrarchaeota archaeon]